MEQPHQFPPVDRRYMSLVVGRKGKSSAHSRAENKSKGSKKADKKESKKASKKASKKDHKVRNEDTPSGDNFVLELTVFHVPAYRRRWF